MVSHTFACIMIVIYNYIYIYCYLQKLQAAKIESEREIASLRKRVEELEKQLSNANKRRKA